RWRQSPNEQVPRGPAEPAPRSAGLAALGAGQPLWRRAGPPPGAGWPAPGCAGPPWGVLALCRSVLRGECLLVLGSDLVATFGAPGVDGRGPGRDGLTADHDRLPDIGQCTVELILLGCCSFGVEPERGIGSLDRQRRLLVVEPCLRHLLLTRIV